MTQGHAPCDCWHYQRAAPLSPRKLAAVIAGVGASNWSGLSSPNRTLEGQFVIEDQGFSLLDLFVEGSLSKCEVRGG